VEIEQDGHAVARLERAQGERLLQGAHLVNLERPARRLRLDHGQVGVGVAGDQRAGAALAAGRSWPRAVERGGEGVGQRRLADLRPGR